MILLEDRSILAIEGKDKFSFLQGLITNDVKPLESRQSQIIYSAMLTPQGKIRFDFFLSLKDDKLLLDAASNQIDDIRKTLNIYKLRADVNIAEHPELCVTASFAPQQDMLQDPRLPAMGYRGIVARESMVGQKLQPSIFYHIERIALAVPDSIDFISDRAFIAEYGLDNLNGVSFTKGCYVGQEIVARTKHKGTVHKILHKVIAEEGSHLPESGTPIIADGKEIGQLRSSLDNQGLAIINRNKLANSKSKILAGNVGLNDITMPEWFNNE